MAMEPVQVMARWEGEGFSPRHFVWRGHVFPVDSIGRQWEDDEGIHILCMVKGGAVFELIFHLKPASWWALPPVAGGASA
jgi:hypothetical protein